MKKKSDKKDKVIETLYSELERKVKLIEKLRDENKLLIKTMLKNSERLKELEDKFKTHSH